MEETEWDRKMQAALTEMEFAFAGYDRCYRDGLDRAMAAMRLRRAFSDMAALDADLANADRRK